jgi:hypothetical protein
MPRTVQGLLTIVHSLLSKPYGFEGKIANLDREISLSGALPVRSLDALMALERMRPRIPQVY